MKILEPEYYSDFQCQGDKCLYHCCQSWRIIIDNETMAKYQKYTGGLKEKMSSIKKDENDLWEIKTDENKQCPFLDECELCEIVKEKGPQDLSYTCTHFPRLDVVTLDTQEKALSLGCPHVVEYLKNIRHTLSFVSYDDGVEVDMNIDLPDDVKTQIQIDMWIREQTIDCVQMTGYPLWFKIFMGYYVLRSTREEYEKNDYEKLAQNIGIMLSRDTMNYMLKQSANSSHIDRHLMYTQIESIANMMRSKMNNSVGKDKRRNDKLIDSIYRAIDKIIYEEYVELNKTTSKFFSDNEYFMENVVVALMYEEMLKAFDREYLMNNYNLIVIFYMLLKFYIQMYIYEEGVINDEIMVVITSVMGRCFMHGKSIFKNVVDRLNNGPWWNPEEVLTYLIE